ncbi:excinuclease ABC subunit UvrA [Halorhodospira halophila]|uniref:UvrABC system protein A n=1 Tax=Halorhodospira halophila (strain DSM 244 / SL1) TaxID=349124 RepID=A1WZ35_HALHL|nr:excinuclease ABC subunit UvrA [Halorhodospira halophila]ABM62947.1 Excinuclease ABC subunit A [Halorhodospira halophila SL1]MBK1727932.1 excinuclease ABC subunit UvrA [Halorhodospira halophila]
MDHIRIRGARTHNLDNLDIDIPRNCLVVITGPSGSGKSSLAFDTLYAEGQRRYVESLSAYARQFLSMMDKPDVDHIEGLSPAISVEQKSASHNPRSTVGTVTEIHDYLRLLFARAGIPYCPEHQVALEASTVSEMVDRILAEPEGSKMMLLAPLVDGSPGEHRRTLEQLRSQGYLRVRIDGQVVELDPLPQLDGDSAHDIEAVIDRFRVRDDLAGRLADSIETALRIGEGVVRVAWMDEPEREALVFSAQHACPECGHAVEPLEPRMFSFNNPQGACPTCDGLGTQHFFDPERVVSRPQLTPAEGAIRGWDRRNLYYFAILQGLAAHYGFSLETPWADLPESTRHCILYGSGDEEIVFHYPGRNGHTERVHPFEGVIPNLERRFREAESATVRDELGRFMAQRTCPECQGGRLNQRARNVRVEGVALPDIAALPIYVARERVRALEPDGARGEIARPILEEIRQRLGFLEDVGLGYLTLDRAAETLSGGEAQRIRLASQIGAGLVGVLYVLDEPSIGLHPRDHDRLLDTLRRLRDLGNSVIVVEHEPDAMRAADHIIDMGPGAGIHGGTVVAAGTPQAVAEHPDSVTGAFLSGRRTIALPQRRRPPEDERWVRMTGARGHNLQDVTAEIPVGLMTCVTGVSGSGKSTLINDTLYRSAARDLNGAQTSPAEHDRVHGLEHFEKVVDIDQSPIGRTPRSNPATYTGVFGPVRELFAATPEARARGYKPGRFSFNVQGGRCEACQGEGVVRVEMHLLPDLYVACDSCHGTRFNRETLEIRYRGYTIHEVLEMTVDQAYEFFEAVPAIRRKLETLREVGLGYLRLGQSATTLSGGEAQRVKLARELSRREHGRNLYILDEPTTGLHFADVEQLLAVLQRLCDHGNTVVVVEHDLDIMRCADWIIDLGPEGGDGGGQILAAGPPEHVAESAASYTAAYLSQALGTGPVAG